MFESELVAVATQPGAFGIGNEETGTDPLPVVVVAVHRGHPPEVHVAGFKRLVAVHGKRPVGRVEIAVNTGIDPQLLKSEILVGCQLKQNIIARGWRCPVQDRLGVSRQVVAREVPNGQPVGGCGETHSRRRGTASPLVGDGERRGVAGIGCLLGVEKDAFAVGVGFVFSSHGDQHVKRVLIAIVKVILHRMVEVEGKTGTCLIAVGQRHRCGAVRTAAIVPLDAALGHSVPGDFRFVPETGFFHAVNGNDRVARVGRTGEFHLGVHDGQIVVESELVE